MNKFRVFDLLLHSKQFDYKTQIIIRKHNRAINTQCTMFKNSMGMFEYLKINNISRWPQKLGLDLSFRPPLYIFYFSLRNILPHQSQVCDSSVAKQCIRVSCLLYQLHANLHEPHLEPLVACFFIRRKKSCSSNLSCGLFLLVYILYNILDNHTKNATTYIHLDQAIV